MSNPEYTPERLMFQGVKKDKPTEEERARMTLKAMMDTCSLATSDMPEGWFRHSRFGEMIWKAFELGRIYEKNRVKNENE